MEPSASSVQFWFLQFQFAMEINHLVVHCNGKKIILSQFLLKNVTNSHTGEETLLGIWLNNGGEHEL
jgi:hypothetical protein